MGIWSCVGLRQESVQKDPSGEVGTDYCSQWGSKQSLRCKPDQRGFKVVEGGLASGTDCDMSILKRGIATMPVSIHRTIAWYSLPSNWHRPSELPPYQSQSSRDLSSWMLKDSILTSDLNSERIPFPQNTLTISQTPSGPSIPMVYYPTLDAS